MTVVGGKLLRTHTQIAGGSSAYLHTCLWPGSLCVGKFLPSPVGWTVITCE